MHHHAVVTGVSLYQAGALTLEQAARYAGVTPDAMRARLRRRNIDLRTDSSSATGEPVSTHS